MIAERPVIAEKRPPAEMPEAAPQVKSRVPGVLFGLALFFFAAFHAHPGLTATAVATSPFVQWSAAVAWFMAAGCLVLAAYGLWGFPRLTVVWRQFASIGSAVSIGLLIGSEQLWQWPMLVVDVLIFSIAIDSEPLSLPNRPKSFLKRGWFGLIRLIAVVFWIYGATAVLSQPWQHNWGATRLEIEKALPGDAPAGGINAINHVVTVNAPPEKIWPWLVQLGQDKAGFYSYDGLERFFGANIHNRFEIRPEWQNLKVGDFIRACPPDYMGGRFGDLGWKVTKLETGQYMVLDNWGTFWLEPTPNGGTRLGVRSAGGKIPFWAAPIEVFGFEPAHFIMEQKMLLTIKSLSETR